MNMSVFILILNVIFSNATNNELTMISDVIKSFIKPTVVTAKVCWTLSNKIKLLSYVMYADFPTTIRFVEDNFDMSDRSPAQHRLFIMDLNCNNSRVILKQASAADKFVKPHRWFLFGITSINRENVLTTLDDLNTFIDSEVIVSEKTDTNKYMLKLIYKIKRNSEWIEEHFGSWTEDNKLVKSWNILYNSITMRRKNIQQEPIVISVVVTHNRTKSKLLDLTDMTTDSASKSTYRHILPLYDFMNASKGLIYNPEWGVFKNNSWTGMIGQLVRGEAEIGGTVTFVTQSRIGVIEYITCPSTSTVKFVFREPSLSYQNNLFILPFNPMVWYCMFSFVMLLIFILYINARWEVNKTTKYYGKALDSTTLRPNVSDITVLIVSAMSQQGSCFELKGTLGRLVMFILFLTFLFLYTAYSASIVALLQSSSNQIRTLSDLLHSRLELGLENTVYNEYYFRTATEPVRKAIYDTKIVPKGQKAFMSVEDGVKKMQNEPFAFNMYLGIGYRMVDKYFYEHEKCGLHEIAYIQESNPYIACRKNTPFMEIYKVGLFRIREHGIGRREESLLISKKPICTARGGSFRSVNMIDCYPILLMLLYGMLISVSILALEKMMYYRRRLGVTTNPDAVAELDS
uniref:Antennal ionotropic receptor 75q.1 n=1 Tax=Dendrolimus punctatus TaxID=238572 RepID=A0A2K8GL72_9NEOP|nr:antennal ionotropic receptor 75q.1 [Dendrolimus punctatus]